MDSSLVGKQIESTDRPNIEFMIKFADYEVESLLKRKLLARDLIWHSFLQS